jgi:hypothetical protein
LVINRGWSSIIVGAAQVVSALPADELAAMALKAMRAVGAIDRVMLGRVLGQRQRRQFLMKAG